MLSDALREKLVGMAQQYDEMGEQLLIIAIRRYGP